MADNKDNGAADRCGATDARIVRVSCDREKGHVSDDGKDSWHQAQVIKTVRELNVNYELQIHSDEVVRWRPSFFELEIKKREDGETW